MSRSTFHDHDDQTAKPRKGKRPGWLSGWQARHLDGLTFDNLTIVTVQGLALSRAGPLDLLTANRSSGVTQKEHKGSNLVATNTGLEGPLSTEQGGKWRGLTQRTGRGLRPQIPEFSNT